MKKFLSLVLALVMTMSLVTVSAGAKDFTDSSKITYKEAVDVMSAVKVIDGYAEGDFRPSTTLTRGAAAKIICNLILGPTTASALVADAAPYKDVPTNHTFAGYIAYCQKEGIISGYADGTFKPANSLTGYAFMKMLLGALGYKADQEGYTGANWSINVAKRAINVGLNDNLNGSFNGVKAVTREEACLYAFNTLKATMVEYDKNSTVTVGNITIKEQSDAKEMANTAKNETIKDDHKMQFAEKYFTDLKLNSKAHDDFMRPANQWKVKAEEIGTYAQTPDATYTAKVKSTDIYKDLALGSAIEKKDVEIYVDGVENDSAAPIAIRKGSDTKVGVSGNGVLTEVFYDDDADTITITQVVTYVGQINKSVAATSKKDAYVVIDTLSSTQNVMAVPSDLTGKTVSKSLEFETDDKFEDDDYVLYTYSQTADEVKSVAAAEKVEGYVSKTTNSTKDEDENKGITIADTAYKMSAATTGEPLGEVSVKNDYTAYLDQYGYVIYVEEIEEIGNYALLINVADKGTFVGKKAELVFTDGTSKVVTTEKDYSKADNLKYDVNKDGKFTEADNTAWSTTAGVADGQKEPVIVTYKVDNDGVYTLKAVDTAKSSYKVASTALNLKNDKASISVDKCTVNDVKDTTYVTANSATQFVVADAGSNEDFTAYTGIKNAPTIAAGKTDGYKTDVFFYCKNGKMVTVMFVLPQSKVTIEDDNNKMIFFAKESGSDLEHDKDSNYFEYNAIVNGEIKTVKVDENATGLTASGANGLFKSFTTDKYGVVSGVKEYNAYGAGLKANPKTQPGDAKEYLAGVGIDKVSKEYTVILNTTGGKLEDGTSASTYTNETISCDDAMKVYYVDKDGNITESSYKSIAKDDNDNVYAIVQDYLVKTLIIQEVESEDDVYGVKVVSTGNATVKVDGSKYAAGKTAEYDKNDEDVVITVTADKDYTIKTVKIDGEEVELDKNGQYTISKIKGLYKLEVETEKVADATMTISVQYVLDDNAGTVVKSEKPAKMTADKGEDYVTVHGTAPDGYTLVSAAEQYVTFVANGSATVKFTVKTTTP